MSWDFGVEIAIAVAAGVYVGELGLWLTISLLSVFKQ